MDEFKTLGDHVREKLASAAERVDEQIMRAVQPEPEPEEGQQKQASTETIEDGDLMKIAGQCDYVAQWLTKIAQNEFESAQGPARGAGAFEMQTPPAQEGIGVKTTGTTSAHKTPEKPQMEVSGAPKENPDTVFKTDYTAPAGAGEGMGPVGADGSTLTPADTAVKKAAWKKRVTEILEKMSAETAGGGFQESTTGPGKGPGAGETNLHQDPPIPAEGKPIQDTQKVIDITQRETKAPVKDELKDFIQEPAQSKKTDPVASDMFAHAEEAGVKISAVETEIAKAYLRKIASRGCTCGGQQACGYCTYQATITKMADAGSKPEEGTPEPATQAIQY